MALADALCSACADGNLTLCKALINRGADINLRSTDGFLPLCLAAFWGYSDVAKLLLKNGADVNGTNGGTNWTSCHCAAFQGHGKVLMTLMEFNPRLDIKDDRNRTAVDFASALDSIWPHFAAQGCKRTSKTELINLKIVTKVPSANKGPSHFSPPEEKAYFSRPGSAYVLKPQQLRSQKAPSSYHTDTELSGKEHAAFSHGDVLTEAAASSSNLNRVPENSTPRFSAWRT
eukprot:gene12894-14222_t